MVTTSWKTKAGIVAALLIASVVGCVGGDPPFSTLDTGRISQIQLKRGPIFGQLLGPDGKPVAGVKMRAFPAESSPLVSNHAAGVVSNHSANLTSSYRIGRQVADINDIAGTTDANGGFVLSPAQSGTYNIEAAQSDSFKAWKSSVNFKAGDSVGLDTMRLQQTGSITGSVRSTLSSVSDFSNTQVYIPGSSYTATTGPDGTYTISNVPVGSFALRAYSPALGDAAVPDALHTGLVMVQPNGSTTAPDLVLGTHAPEITSLTRSAQDGSDTGETTDNAAAGQYLYVHGNYFGYSRGVPSAVSFSGGNAIGVDGGDGLADRQSESLLRVKVPRDAQSGTVALKVGNLVSKTLNFRKIVRYGFPSPTLTVLPHSTKDLLSLLKVTDSNGEDIVAAPGVWYRPNVFFKLADTAVAVLDASGSLTALSTGAATVTASAGDLVSGNPSLVVTISDNTVGTPAPAVSSIQQPSATPTTGPNGYPTTSPNGAPTGMPTGYPNPYPSVLPTTAPTGSPASAPVAQHTAASVFTLPHVGNGGEVLGGLAMDSDNDVLYVAERGGVWQLTTPDSDAAAATPYVGNVGHRGSDWGFGDGSSVNSDGGCNPRPNFGEITGLTFDITNPARMLYLADAEAANIRRVDPGAPLPPGAPTMCGGPIGTVFTLAGNGYSPEFSVWPPTYSPHFLGGKPEYTAFHQSSYGDTASAGPPSSGVVFRKNLQGGDDSLVIADSEHHVIASYDLRTHETTQLAPLTHVPQTNIDLTQLNLPEGLALDAAGDLLVADPGNHCISKVLLSGNVVPVAGTGTSGNSDGTMSGPSNSATFEQPSALAYDPNWYETAAPILFVADYAAGTIRRLDFGLNRVTTIVSGLSQPVGLALDSRRHLLYVTELHGADVKRVAL